MPSLPPSSLPGLSEGSEGFAILRVTVKVVNPDRKSEYKNYLVRDVDPTCVQTLNEVKSLLKEELGEILPTGFQFDIGFYRGNKQVWMRTDSDVQEFWQLLREKPECVLWCMGRSGKKSKGREHRPT